MSFLDLMDSALESPQTALHMLLTKMNNTINTLHVYYEGKCDNKLYYGMIRRLVADSVNIRTVVCGNKKKVFSFRNELIERGNDKNRIIFFVDKDIDDFFDDHSYVLTEDMHQSLYYSIENYVSCEQVLISICRECFDMTNLENSNNELYMKLLESYKGAEKTFYQVVKDIMIFAFIARRNISRPVLNNMKFSDLFYFDDKCNIHFELKGNYQNLVEYFMDKTKCDISAYLHQYDEIESMINTIDERFYIRGKYHLEMFCAFLLSLQKAVGDILPYKQKFQINDESIFLFSGPRITIPASINDFITNNAADFIKNN